MKTLLGIDVERFDGQLKSGTFFRIYFGEQGRKILAIRRSEINQKPEIFSELVTAGASLSSSSREHFLAQGLWKIPLNDMKNATVSLGQESKKYFEVDYV